VIRFEIEQEIQRPVSEVFAYITDVANLPQWQSGAIEATADGPVALGTQVTERRTFFGRRLETTLDVTEFEPDRLFTLSARSGPIPFQVRHRLQATADGTSLRLEGESEPDGILRLAGRAAARAVEHELKQSVAALKQILERPR
jgi:uncharacterized protein YndB with AHSA1/START domain